MLMGGGTGTEDTAQGKLGSKLLISYEDGTTRQEISEDFQSWFTLQGVYDGDKLISMVGITALLEVHFPTSWTSPQHGEVKMDLQISYDGLVHTTDTISFVGDIIAGSIHAVELVSLDADTIMQWTNSTGIHTLEFAIQDCHIIFASLEAVIEFGRHAITLNVNVTTDLSAPTPPEEEPPEEPEPPPTTPTYILHETFEGTFPGTGWTTRTTSGDIIVKSTTAKAGTYSLGHTTDGLPVGSEMCYSQVDLVTQYTSAYFSCYFRFNKLPTTGTTYIPIDIRARTEAPGAMAYATVNANGQIRLVYRNADLADFQSYLYTGKTLSANVWYHIEIYVRVGTPGTVTMWVDGTQAFTDSIRNNEWGGTRFIQYGERWSTSGAHVVYIDECKVDDVRINP